MARKRREADTIEGRERVEERRRHILAAAAVVFARSGYHGACTRDIAEEAGIAEGTIYNYYASKRDLLIALIEHIVTESILATLIQADEEDPRSWFRAVLLDRLEMLHQNRDLITAVAAEMLTDSELRERYLRQVVLPILAQFLPLTQQFQRKHLRSFDARIILPAIVGSAVVAFIFNEYVDFPMGKTKSRQELVDELVGFFLDGLRRRGDEDTDRAIPTDATTPGYGRSSRRGVGRSAESRRLLAETSQESLVARHSGFEAMSP